MCFGGIRRYFSMNIWTCSCVDTEFLPCLSDMQDQNTGKVKQKNKQRPFKWDATKQRAQFPA